MPTSALLVPLLANAHAYLALLDLCGVGWVEWRPQDRGVILYADDVQIVVGRMNLPSPSRLTGWGDNDRCCCLRTGPAHRRAHFSDLSGQPPLRCWFAS